MNLIAKAALAVMLKRAKTSVSSWLITVGSGAGVAAALDPDLLAYVPHAAIPYVVAGYGLLCVLARHRDEITKLYTELRAEIPAAIDAGKDAGK